MQLMRYEAARTALAEAHRVDEVKDIRDKAEAMAAYARQARDTALVQYATEIKVRAERRCGELLRDSERNGGAKGVGPIAVERYDTNQPTLADLGITRDQSSRYQKLAAMPEEHFEAAVATAKENVGEVTTAFMLRQIPKRRAASRPQKGARADAMRKELAEAAERGVSMLCTYARLLLTAINNLQQFTDAEQALLDELLTTLKARRETQCQ